MYYLVRLILLLLLALILFIVIFLKKKRVKLKVKEFFLYVFFILQVHFLFSLIPFEREIVTFQTPIEAYNYLYPWSVPDKIIETERGAFILYYDHFNCNFVMRKGEKWKYKARHINTENIKGFIKADIIECFLLKVINRECNEQLIFLEEMAPGNAIKIAELRDNLNSTFNSFTYEDDESKESKICYYTVISADVTDYELTINGKVAEQDSSTWSEEPR